MTKDETRGHTFVTAVSQNIASCTNSSLYSLANIFVLSVRLRTQERQIQVWFQNRRQRERRLKGEVREPEDPLRPLLKRAHRSSDSLESAESSESSIMESRPSSSSSAFVTGQQQQSSAPQITAPPTNPPAGARKVPRRPSQEECDSSTHGARSAPLMRVQRVAPTSPPQPPRVETPQRCNSLDFEYPGAFLGDPIQDPLHDRLAVSASGRSYSCGAPLLTAIMFDAVARQHAVGDDREGGGGGGGGGEGGAASKGTAIGSACGGSMPSHVASSMLPPPLPLPSAPPRVALPRGSRAPAVAPCADRTPPPRAFPPRTLEEAISAFRGEILVEHARSLRSTATACTAAHATAWTDGCPAPASAPLHVPEPTCAPVSHDIELPWQGVQQDAKPRGRSERTEADSMVQVIMAPSAPYPIMWASKVHTIC